MAVMRNILYRAFPFRGTLPPEREGEGLCRKVPDLMARGQRDWQHKIFCPAYLLEWELPYHYFEGSCSVYGINYEFYGPGSGKAWNGQWVKFTRNPYVVGDCCPEYSGQPGEGSELFFFESTLKRVTASAWTKCAASWYTLTFEAERDNCGDPDNDLIELRFTMAYTVTRYSPAQFCIGRTSHGLTAGVWSASTFIHFKETQGGELPLIWTPDAVNCDPDGTKEYDLTFHICDSGPGTLKWKYAWWPDWYGDFGI